MDLQVSTTSAVYLRTGNALEVNQQLQTWLIDTGRELLQRLPGLQLLTQQTARERALNQKRMPLISIASPQTLTGVNRQGL